MAWNQRSTLLEYCDEPCLIGSEPLGQGNGKPGSSQPQEANSQKQTKTILGLD